MKITVQEFVQTFIDKKITNTKIAPDAISKYIRDNLEIKTYIPFAEKRRIAEMIVEKYITEVSGIKKYDEISSYVGFISAMIVAHTSLQFSNNSVTDYDLLAQSGLLTHLIAEFQESYSECDIILKMAISMELEDNNVGALIGRFFAGILETLDGMADGLKSITGDEGLKNLLGIDINKEDLAEIIGLIDKLK